MYQMPNTGITNREFEKILTRFHRLRIAVMRERDKQFRGDDVNRALDESDFIYEWNFPR